MIKLHPVVIFAFISLIFVGSAEAKSAKSTKKAATSAKTEVTKKSTLPGANSQLGTSFSFDAASVRGKYQLAGQGIASVQDEKVMDDLLGIRRQFKDREVQEESRD
jgi:hypothetical protein